MKKYAVVLDIGGSQSDNHKKVERKRFLFVAIGWLSNPHGRRFAISLDWPVKRRFASGLP
jgi:hypothetical protein